MNVALRRRMTQQEFLDWAEARDGRYEFDGFGPVAMVGGTNNHGIISRNLTVRLFNRLGAGPCQSMTSEGGGVATVGDVVRYPDATVTCSPMSGRERLVAAPVVVFEVLSPNSRHMDLAVKPAEYAAVPSIQRYVVVEQDRPEIRGYVRTPEGGWTGFPPLGPGEALDLPEIGIVLPVVEIYERVVFDA